MQKQSKKNSGFTLIELMVVVAIIGILAAVALPQYQKFQGKARQSEAKVLLGAVLTAEKAFFVENTQYMGCLSGIGAAPEETAVNSGINKGFYAMGFVAAPIMAVGANPAMCTDVASGTFFTANQFFGSVAGLASRASLPATAVMPAAGNFVCGAAANLGKGTAAGNVANGADQWTIDANGTLLNTHAGI